MRGFTVGFWCLSALTLALLALAGYAVVRSSPPQPGFTVAELVRDLGEVPVAGAGRVEEDVVFTLVNEGRTPAAVVGAGDLCGLNACLSVNHSGRVVIPPAASAALRCTVSMEPELGPFEASAPVFVDDGGLRTILLTVRGTKVPARPEPTTDGGPP